MARTKAAMIAMAVARKERPLADKALPDAKRPKLIETAIEDLEAERALHQRKLNQVECSHLLHLEDLEAERALHQRKLDQAEHLENSEVERALHATKIEQLKTSIEDLEAAHVLRLEDLKAERALHAAKVDQMMAISSRDSVTPASAIDTKRFHLKRKAPINARTCMVFKEAHEVWTPETFPKPEGDGFIYVTWEGNGNGTRRHLLKSSDISDHLWKMLVAAHQHVLYQDEVFAREPFATVAHTCSEEAAQTLREAFTIIYETDSKGDDIVTSPPALYLAIEKLGVPVDTNCRVDLKHVSAHIEIDEDYTYEGYDYCPRESSFDEEDDS